MPPVAVGDGARARHHRAPRKDGVRACHAAWAAQEYGTFLVKPQTRRAARGVRAAARGRGLAEAARASGGRTRRRWDSTPAAWSRRSGPQFVLFATDPARGWENRLLAAEWKPFFPHTIRRGTVTCGGCHENPRRFVLEPPADRIYDLERDGLPLRSWWDQDWPDGVVGGAFFTQERYDLMNRQARRSTCGST